ncbi:Tn7-like element transposition protein TnsE [Clostridium butyricum]|uniref:Tn7-like element transposition protein TnsE n=1 Tax=Clostridium butyricum TaxID=1492 RepID=UPI00374FCD1E
MSKEAVIIKSWPFGKGEKVKLTWIGEPFKQNNKWMVYAYFKGASATRRIILDWASIHFLSVEKYYTDGNLNSSEAVQNAEVIDINLNGIKAEYKEKDWEIWGTGFKEKTKSKTFNFLKNGVLYTIPIIEVIRAVLAPNKFMLNRILEMDTFESYFTYEMKNGKLDIHFTSEYESKLLKSKKVYHLAWIITNISVLRMFNSVGQGIWEKEKLEYDFLLDKFSIRARVEKKDKFIRILEIIALNKKAINAEEINIFHPSLEESKASNDTKKRKYVSNNGLRDRELASDADGSTKKSDEIDTFMINHEYERVTKINKKKTGRKIIRSTEDKNTKTYVLDNDNLRTTADNGGEDVIKGLEFRNISEIKEKGELQKFIELLMLLEKRQDVKSVELIIDNIPEGKKFSKLKDEIRKRKYAVGKITIIDGTQICLIDVEREDKALSMLILKANNLVNWKRICSILIIGLVNESGKWSSYIIEKIQQHGVLCIRKKHTKKCIHEREIQIYNDLL